jgi:GNAT superfamily N-acetyltransferase
MAILDTVDYYGRGRIITRINVPVEFTGKGHGRDLLAQVIADADRDGVTLFLEIFSTGAMLYDELEAWYMRHGFKRWKGVYRRVPEVKK